MRLLAFLIHTIEILPCRKNHAFRARRAGQLTPAQQDLCQRFIPLAHKLAKPLKQAWPNDADDFESAALLALVEAAEAFDPSLPVNFQGFARGKILSALKDLHRAKAKELHRPLNRPSASQATLSPAQYFEERDAAEALLKPLPPKHREVMKLIYLSGKSQAEAALALKTSQTRVCRLHREALNLLREADRAQSAPPREAPSLPLPIEDTNRGAA